MKVLIVRNVNNIDEAIRKIDRVISKRGQIILKSRNLGNNFVGITLLNLREGKIEEKTFAIKKVGDCALKFMDIHSSNIER